MTVIEIPDEQAERLKAQAEARGLTIAEWIVELAGPAPTTPEPGADDRPIWEILADSFRDLPPEDLALLPEDGASQVDHYVYGHPKRD